jgi:hypothetical protein
MPLPQDLRPARAIATLVVLASTIAASPIHAQRASAPTGLQVTGTAVSATVTWQPVKGAVSYSVKRWKRDDLKCCNNSVEGLTQPLWTDHGAAREGFPQPGVYVFEVTASRKGSSAAAVLDWTLPAEPRLATTNGVPTQQRPAEGRDALVPVTSPTAVPPPVVLTVAPATATYVPVTVTAAAPAPAAAPAAPPAATPAPPTTAKRTALIPATQGFRFVNDFKNSFIGPPISMQTSGLCGGMSYAVLDYYFAGQPIPSQDYRPANGTTLQQYFYGRQVTSLTQNLDKWAETSVNPFGSRTLEFFNWGINERLKELGSFIDRGVPVPLGLKGTGAGLDHDHQVLAIGYDMGRYKGDLGAYKEDVKIYLLDPNYPTQTVTLVPNPATLEYYELEHPTNHWRTYFVDGKYQRMAPPNIVTPGYPSDGLVHELRLELYTGMDDMRGGADHVDLAVRLANGTTQSYTNISQNGLFLPMYLETVQVILSQPVSQQMIKTFELNTNATGGLNGDNWDLQSVQVYAVGGGFNNSLLSSRAGPYRFTGARTPFVIDVK